MLDYMFWEKTFKVVGLLHSNFVLFLERDELLMNILESFLVYQLLLLHFRFSKYPSNIYIFNCSNCLFCSWVLITWLILKAFVILRGKINSLIFHWEFFSIFIDSVLRLELRSVKQKFYADKMVRIFNFCILVFG